MAHLDFKITSWKRFAVPDDKVDEVIAKLKESDCDEVYDLQEIEGVFCVQTGPDAECEEAMIPDENFGFSTQELYSSEGDLIYYNGKQDE